MLVRCPPFYSIASLLCALGFIPGLREGILIWRESSPCILLFHFTFIYVHVYFFGRVAAHCTCCFLRLGQAFKAMACLGREAPAKRQSGKKRKHLFFPASPPPPPQKQKTPQNCMGTPLLHGGTMWKKEKGTVAIYKVPIISRLNGEWHPRVTCDS